jgi:peptidoglycan/LPS O-acetylase OafA/YrhL
MIQRIQTVYLLLTAIILLVVATLGVLAHPATYIDWAFVIWSAVTGLLAIAAIGLFKNRPKQLGYSRLIMLFSLSGFIASTIFLLIGETANKSNFIVLFGAFCAALCLTTLAAGAIRKDEKLVRAADRLR